jgi:hypothetical protein
LAHFGKTGRTSCLTDNETVGAKKGVCLTDNETVSQTY